MNMFKYSAFIRKNTQELRDKLEGMGYRDNSMYGYGNSWDYDCLSTNGNISEYDECDFDQINFDTVNDRIDCITNEKAFLAIAAINDDTDKNQWFIMNGYIFEYSEETVLLKDHWYFCDNDNIKDCFELLPGDNINIRKATPDEILNRLDEN